MQKNMGAMMKDMGAMTNRTNDPALKTQMQKMHDHDGPHGQDGLQYDGWRHDGEFCAQARAKRRNCADRSRITGRS